MGSTVYRAPVLAALRFLIVAAGWPLAADAFGPSGHRVVGHVADSHVCGETRAALKPLLGGLTLAEAGLWPDTIRRQPGWEHTAPWHYINVPDRGPIARVARRTPDNVLAALARFERELADPSLTTRQRGIALRFVVHFVADLHQPLHVGRASDRGGNLVPVRVAGRDLSLHAVWDGEPLRAAGGPAPKERALALPRPSAKKIARWQQAAPLDWAAESRALWPRVYAFPAGPDGAPAVLDAPYVDRARHVVDERLLQAGVRLAGRLDALVGPPGGCGPKVASSRPNL